MSAVILNWHRTTQALYWCALKADDGRVISLEFWHRHPVPVKCSTCGHSIEKHGSGIDSGRGSTSCNHYSGAYCSCLEFIPGTNPRYPVELTTEVRFRGLVRIKNGQGTSRTRRRGREVRAGTTTSSVMLYAMPLGSLLSVARAGLPLLLRPTKRRYAHGMAVLGAEQLAALSVAVDASLVSSDWVVETEDPSPGLPPASAQMEAFT